MKTANLTMRICLKRKRIILARTAIKALGCPTHLSFWYDESNHLLIFTPADKDELDAYEIPKYFWNDTNQICEISRIAFLKALQYRIGWEDGSKYLFQGTLTESNSVPAVMFYMDKGSRTQLSEN